MPWKYLEGAGRRAQACDNLTLRESRRRVLKTLTGGFVFASDAARFWAASGFHFAEKVNVSLVDDGRARPFPFDRGLFQYRGKLQDLKVADDLGFAGFRLLCRLPGRPHYQE